MAIQGNSQTLGIPDLFNFICNRRMSGMLVLASLSQDRSFYFRNGDVVYAHGSEPGYRIGEILVRELGLNPASIEDAISTHTTGFLGETLVSRGIVEQASVDAVIERQIRVILREVLQWERWAFHFEKQDLSRSTPSLQLSTQLLIFDLARELDEWRSLESIVPDIDLIVMRNPGSIQSRVPLDWNADLPPLGEVLMDIEGERSIRRVLQESRLPVRPHAMALSLMLGAGVLQTRPAGATAAPTKPVAQELLLPIVPHLASRILCLEAQGTDSLDAYIELIQADPLLVARVMRAASTRGADASERFSVRTIIGRIGLEQVKGILFAEAVRRLFLVPGFAAGEAAWEHTIRCGSACRAIAEATGYQNVELAAGAGLLQDLGAIALAGREPNAAREIHERARSTVEGVLEAEQQLYGTDHCALGGDLAEAWGFPRSLITVIREHHTPIDAYAENVLLNIARLAQQLVAPSMTDTMRGRSLLKRLIRQLGVAVSDLERIQEQVQRWNGSFENVGVLAPAR